ERAGKLQAALLAEGQVGGEIVALARKARELERGAEPLAIGLPAPEPARQDGLRALLAVAVLGHPQVLPDGELAEQADVLESAGDAARDTGMRRQLGYVLGVDDDAPRRRREQ